MDKKCLTCLINSSKKDSIISNYSLQIKNFKEISNKKDIILNDNQQTIFKLEDENQKINLHLVRAKRNIKVFGVGGLCVGIIGTIFLMR